EQDHKPDSERALEKYRVHYAVTAARSLVRSRTATWHATSRCPLCVSEALPPGIGRSSGTFTSQRPASESGQRGWNVHPGGSRSRLGISALRSSTRLLERVMSGSAS